MRAMMEKRSRRLNSRREERGERREERGEKREADCLALACEERRVCRSRSQREQRLCAARRILKRCSREGRDRAEQDMVRANC